MKLAVGFSHSLMEAACAPLSLGTPSLQRPPLTSLPPSLQRSTTLRRLKAITTPPLHPPPNSSPRSHPTIPVHVPSPSCAFPLSTQPPLPLFPVLVALPARSLLHLVNASSATAIAPRAPLQVCRTHSLQTPMSSVCLPSCNE